MWVLISVLSHRIENCFERPDSFSLFTDSSRAKIQFKDFRLALTESFTFLSKVESQLFSCNRETLAIASLWLWDCIQDIIWWTNTLDNKERWLRQANKAKASGRQKFFPSATLAFACSIESLSAWIRYHFIYYRCVSDTSFVLIISVRDCEQSDTARIGIRFYSAYAHHRVFQFPFNRLISL